MNQENNNPTLEDAILCEFRAASKHLRGKEKSQTFQEEMLAIAQPYHDKLKELAYPWEVSVVMLRKAFYAPIEEAKQ